MKKGLPRVATRQYCTRSRGQRAIFQAPWTPEHYPQTTGGKARRGWRQVAARWRGAYVPPAAPAPRALPACAL